MAEQAEEVEEGDGFLDHEVTMAVAAVQDGLNNIGELCTAEYFFKDVITYDDAKQIHGWNIPLTSSGFVYTYEGSVKAGVDFNDISVESDDEKKSIIITIPSVKTISKEVDESSFELYDEKSSIFNPYDINDVMTSREELIDKAEQTAIEKGLYETAEANAITQIQQLVSNIGVTDEYTVEVRPADGE